jgi:hypothetical protein
MTGEMSTGKAIAAPITQEDINRLVEAGSLSVDAMSAREVMVGLSEVLSLDGLQTALREVRTRSREEPIADCLRSLRKDLREFVNTNNREPEGFGFGTPGGEPLDCSGIMKRVQETVTRLEIMGEDRDVSSPLAAAQRSVVPQVSAVLEEFLVDLTAGTKGGEVNRSDIVPVLKTCINLSSVVGEVVHALSAMRMEMAARTRAS